MREIKFRGWATKSKVMFDDVIPDIRKFCTDLTADTWFSGEVMQYSGLDDKNGNPIYEGDTIINELISGTVVFDSGSFSIQVEKLMSKDAGYDIGNCPTLFEFTYNEITGNIYEKTKK